MLKLNTIDCVLARYFHVNETRIDPLNPPLLFSLRENNLDMTFMASMHAFEQIRSNYAKVAEGLCIKGFCIGELQSIKEWTPTWRQISPQQRAYYQKSIQEDVA